MTLGKWKAWCSVLVVSNVRVTNRMFLATYSKQKTTCIYREGASKANISYPSTGIIRQWVHLNALRSGTTDAKANDQPVPFPFQAS